MTNSRVTRNELDSLLENSVVWLKDIEAGCFQDLEKVLVQHDRSMVRYMKGKELRTLAGQERDKLYKILSNQNEAIKLISEQKQEVAQKLLELRKGRNLKNAYG